MDKNAGNDKRHFGDRLTSQTGSFSYYLIVKHLLTTFDIMLLHCLITDSAWGFRKTFYLEFVS